MTRVLYTVDMGISTRKVDSWCISRLGGSPARATRKTPPFCGFSSARAMGTAHSPTISATLSMSPSNFLRPIGSPPVWELCQHLELRPSSVLPTRLVLEMKEVYRVCAIRITCRMAEDQGRVIGT